MKPSLILVDGMNIADRSKAVKNIASRFSKDSFELYASSDTAPAYLYMSMMCDALERKKHVIIENSWRSEYAMEAMGQGVRMPIEMRRMLDRVALGCNAQVAYCYADTRTYAANANLVSSYESLKDVIWKMHGVWENLDPRGLLVTKVNMSDDTYTMDIDLLMDRLEMQAGTNIGPGIGCWKPGEIILLIGDRHGPSTQPYKVNHNLAFCDMAKAGSSFWLSKKLEDAQIPENKLYWINAFDKDDQATDPNFIDHLRPQTVLTLGDAASRWCSAYKIRHESFKHPQFHKRFHFNEPYPVIERLKELVS